MENLEILDLLLEMYLDEPVNYGEKYEKIDKKLNDIIKEYIKDDKVYNKVSWLQAALITIVTGRSFYSGFYYAIKLLKELKLI